MNITVNAKRLLQDLRVLEKIVAQKTVLPILSNVLMQADGDQVRLSTTDTEISLTASCPAQVAEAGHTTVPVKRLLDILAQVDDTDVHLILDAKAQFRIASGNFKSRLQTLPADDFPTLPSVEGTGQLISVATLRTLARKVRCAISSQQQKYFLGGALLSLTENVLALVATDGKRLALATAARTAGQPQQVLLPTKMLDLIVMQETVAEEFLFSVGARQIFLTTENFVMSSRMMEGTFPAYQRIIPRNNVHVLNIGREAMLAAIRRVSLTASDSRAMQLSFEANALSLLAVSAEIGEAIEHLPITYAGPAMKLTMDWQFIVDFLEASSGQFISLAVKDAETAALFSDGSDYINVVILMRT